MPGAGGRGACSSSGRSPRRRESRVDRAVGQTAGGEQPVVLADVVGIARAAAVRPAEAAAVGEVAGGRILRGKEVVADVDPARGGAPERGQRQHQRDRGCRNDQGPSHRLTSSSSSADRTHEIRPSLRRGSTGESECGRNRRCAARIRGGRFRRVARRDRARPPALRSRRADCPARRHPRAARGPALAGLGPTGAGKTTLLRILATRLRPTAGGSRCSAARCLARRGRPAVAYLGHEPLCYRDLPAPGTCASRRGCTGSRRRRGADRRAPGGGEDVAVGRGAGSQPPRHGQRLAVVARCSMTLSCCCSTSRAPTSTPRRPRWSSR